MSRAGDWAIRYLNLVDARNALDADLHDGRLMFASPEGKVRAVAQASRERGVLLQLQQAHMLPDEALALARWILDTFGDGK